MSSKRKIGTLLVTLGFVMSVLAVFAPAGATGGRAENFVVTVTFTNPDGSHDNSSVWNETAMINITANVSIASGMENVTDLKLELALNGDQFPGTPVSLGGLNASEFREITWQANPPSYGDYIIMVTAINGTDTANQAVKTVYYRSLDSDISIAGVMASPATALIGVDEVTVSAALANKGNMEGSASVSFMLDGTMDLGTVVTEVPAGETVNADLVTKYSGLLIADGTHTITASMTDLTPSTMEVGDINLTNPKANVTIDDLKVDKASAYEGDKVTFTVTLTNSGTADAPNITVDFSELVILVYMSIGQLPNVTVAKGTTVNVTWAYTLPNITGTTENKTIRAGYGEGIVLTTYKTINVTTNKKLPKLEYVTFTAPTGKRINEMAEFTIKVMNNGTATATGIVIKLMEGAMAYTNVSAAFNLTVGESKEVKLGITLTGDGDKNHTYTAVATVGGVDYKKDATVMVGHEIFASIGIKAFKISPTKKENQPKDSSQSYTATVTLKNVGEKAGSVQLILMEGIKIIGNQTVSVDALAQKDVKMTFKVKGSGTHKITAMVSLPNPDPMNMTKTASCELKYQPGFELVVLIGAIIVAAVVVGRRKK